jgi:predicted secreted protein
MSFVGSILIFSSIWMIVFFMVLPYGVKNQVNSDHFQKGTDPGAPVESKMKKKFLITTLISVVIFSLIFTLAELNLLQIRKILF